MSEINFLNRIKNNLVTFENRMYINGELVSSENDVDLFKKQILVPIKDKTFFMIGLGYGYDCMYLLENGAKRIDVLEKYPEVIKRFTSLNKKHKKLKIILGEYPYYNIDSNKYDYVIYSMPDSYRIID